jgi:hypothetical protein
MMEEGGKAGAVAAIAVGAFHGLATKFVPAYASLPRSPKLFWLSSAVVAAYWVRAEQAHLERMEAIRLADDAARQARDDQWRRSK